MKLSEALTAREVQAFRVLSGGSLRDVRISRGDEEGPGSLVCYGCGCAPADEDGLVRVATSLPNHIVINPLAWEPGTAAFFALVRHEDVHQGQFRIDPDFLRRYQAWERRREYLGQPPYKNPSEWHAYVAEVEAYKFAIEHLGLPRGRRVPLLLAE